MADEGSSLGNDETLRMSSKPSSAAYDETLRPSSATQAATSLIKKIGHYDLVRQIGKGGFGLVYEAIDTRLKRRVAIKVMRSGEDSSPEEIRRFRLEAESAAKLKHPNIVPIHDVGRFDDVEYFSMDFVEGVTLGDWLRQKERTFRERAAMIEKVARAIHHAHEKGVIHRDIKPGNVMVNAAGEPHVMDFGLARSVAGGSSLTASGAALGTPAYMPPEQAEGRHGAVGPQSDVWSLGAVIYEALTGRPPFTGETVLQVVRAVVHDDPLPPRKTDPSIPADLETVCLKCLEKETTKRYASAEDLAADLERWQKHEPILARPVTAVERAVKWSKRRPAAAGLLIVSNALLLTLLIFTPYLMNALKAAREAEANALNQQQRADKKAEEALAEKEKARQEAERAKAAEAKAEENYAGALVRQGDAYAGVGEGARPSEAHAAYQEAWDRYTPAPPPLNVLAGLALFYERFAPPLLTFNGHTSFVSSVAVSADGRMALSGSYDATLKLWDTIIGRELRAFSGHAGWVTSVALSPDGKYGLSGSADKTLRLWEIASGKELHVFSGHAEAVWAVAFSPDGKQALSGSHDKTLRLWDVATGRPLRTFQGHTEVVWAVAFSPDGNQALSGSWDKTLKVWEVATGRELSTFSGHSNWISSVAFSPDGKQVLSGSRDKTVKLWEIATGKELHTFSGHLDQISSVAFSADGKQVLSGSSDKTLKLWDAATGSELCTYNGHTDQVSSAVFSSSGKHVISGSVDTTVKLWDLATDRELRIFNGQANVVWSMAGLLKPGKRMNIVWSVAVSPDGTQALSGNEDYTLKLWDLATGRELRIFNGHLERVFSVAFSPCGKQALSGSRDKTIKLWDLASGKEVRAFSGHTGWVMSVAVSPDGKQALSGSEDTTIKLWDMATGHVLRTFNGHTNAVTRVVFSPDGRQALSGSRDSTIKLWDLAMEKELRTFSGHVRTTSGVSSVSSVAFSPDGRQALSGSTDKSLKLWDLATGRDLCTFSGHTSAVSSVAFSPNGKHVLSGSEDKTLKLWDSATGKELRAFIGHTSMVTSVAFSPGGRQLLSGSDDQTLKLWDFSRPIRYREFERAIPEAQIALQRNPGDASALKTLGEWFAFRGVNDWAVDKLEAARAGGANVSALTLARSYWQLGRLPAAAREFQRELERVKTLVPEDAKSKQARESEELYLVLCLQAVKAAMDK